MKITSTPKMMSPLPKGLLSAAPSAVPGGQGVGVRCQSLPPGWVAQERQGSARTYRVFYGPNGEYAESVPQAWRGGRENRHGLAGRELAEVASLSQAGSGLASAEGAQEAAEAEVPAAAAEAPAAAEEAPAAAEEEEVRVAYMHTP